MDKYERLIRKWQKKLHLEHEQWVIKHAVLDKAVPNYDAELALDRKEGNR